MDIYGVRYFHVFTDTGLEYRVARISITPSFEGITRLGVETVAKASQLIGSFTSYSQDDTA
jgi:hypothetical protein